MKKYREEINFNSGWLYLPKDYQGGEAVDIDESAFERVSVPHANKVIAGHKGDDFQKHIDSYRFVSWYRRHFTLDKSCLGRRIIAEFDGVATVADVYVNGSYAFGHKGAYTGFGADITPYINFGKDNVIAVRVNSKRRGDVPPEGGEVDYCVFGGIVRNVRLLAVADVHAENVFLSTPSLSAQSGRVSCKAALKNCSSADRLCSFETIIYDADLNEVAFAASGEAIVKAGELASLSAVTSEIVNPHLWSVDDPYLYTAYTVIKENGIAVDSVKTDIGLRWFEFKSTPKDGRFYLNGEKTVLRGINRHEQWPWQGRAIPDRLQAADADLIKETGFNAVRCSHYPQSPAFLDRCDQIGLIVFEEAPGWQHIGDEDWQRLYKTNLREMILRDCNHPSIVTWGVRVNESWDSHDFYTDTHALAKSLDPTRPTHGVRRNENYADSEKIEDIFCANYQYPAVPRYTPFVSTEHSWECWTNGCGSPWASDAQAMSFTKSFGDVVDYYYRNELCAGGFGWSMFDYNNEVNYTKTGHVFYSGLYDIFRQPKPVAYFYASQRDDKTVIYIANYWTADSPSEVQVYSNCQEVELFVNGRSKGRILPNLYTGAPHPAFSFKDIGFEDGELKAVGYIGGKRAAEAVRLTPREAKKLVLTPDRALLFADGSDMTAVIVEAVDENGTRLPYADNEVEIYTEGAGSFIGERQIRLEGGRTAFFVKSEYAVEGIVNCRALSEGLDAGSCEIRVSL